jgi:hypothetical protein
MDKKLKKKAIKPWKYKRGKAERIEAVERQSELDIENYNNSWCQCELCRLHRAKTPEERRAIVREFYDSP